MTSTTGQSSRSVMSTCLPKISSARAVGGGRVLVDAPGQPQLAGLVAVQAPGDDAPDPADAGDLGDLGFDFGSGPASGAAGQGGAQVVEGPSGFGQGCAGEAAGLVFVQLG